MTVQSRPFGVTSLWRTAIFTVLLAIPSALAVTNQSLWTVEFESCRYADHLYGWDMHRHLALVLMPVYHLFLAGRVRLFGDSEWTLRGSNLPFALLFLETSTA